MEAVIELEPLTKWVKYRDSLLENRIRKIEQKLGIKPLTSVKRKAEMRKLILGHE